MVYAVHEHLNPQEFGVPFAKTRAETQAALRAFAGEHHEDPESHLEGFAYIERNEPLEQVKRGVMADPEIASHGDFDTYHRWYVEGGDIPDHGRSRWPAIRGDEEYFDDGWHRFHSYVAAGDDAVPTVEMLPQQAKTQRVR